MEERKTERLTLAQQRLVRQVKPVARALRKMVGCEGVEVEEMLKALLVKKLCEDYAGLLVAQVEAALDAAAGRGLS